MTIIIILLCSYTFGTGVVSSQGNLVQPLVSRDEPLARFSAGTSRRQHAERGLAMNNIFSRFHRFAKQEKGAVAVTTALLLVVLLGGLGLSFDLGHYYVVRQQLKNAADAAALAGVRAIFPYDLSTATLPIVPLCDLARSKGLETANANRTDRLPVQVAEIQTGYFNWKTREFVPSCSSDPNMFTNAVRVTTHRESVPLFFMQVLGAVPRTLSTTSIAVMDWVGSLKPHSGLGLALGAAYAQDGYLEIPVNDDSSDKGAWYATPPLKPNDGLLMDYLTGNALIPMTTTGDSVFLNNGVFNNVIRYLGENCVGHTFLVPIVDTIKFNQEQTIVGFGTFTITGIGKKGGKHYIAGRANILREAPPELGVPGGSNFGLLSSAKLVY